MYLKKKLQATALFLLFTLSTQFSFAEETGAFVVTIKMDLYTEIGHEAGCVATQMGLLMLNRGSSVIMFASLDGVEIANATRLSYISDVSEYVYGKKCATPSGKVTLKDLVNKFVASGGSIIACPLCWSSRFSDDPTATLVEGATIGTAESMGDMLSNAEKILDF